MFCSMGLPQAIVAGWDRAYALALSLIKSGDTHTIGDIFSGEMIIVRQGINKEEILELKERAFRYSGIE